MSKKDNTIDFGKIDWGTLTNQFKRSKIPKVDTLKEFAEYVEDHPTKFHSKTLKRARFYTNVIEPKKGGALNPLVPFHTIEYGKVVGSHSAPPVRRYSRPYRKKKSHPNYMNPWIAFVKAFASKHSLKYSDAIKDPRCKAEYAKKKSGSGMESESDEEEGMGMESAGDMSKTHKGEKDYSTKKGDKYYHQQHHLVAGTPYTKKMGKGMVDNFISQAYNGSQLGANGGRKFISL